LYRYYNKKYAWDHTPIGGNLDCSNYSSCEQGLVEDCPWQCRYGKATQDYIIDGSGVYVTRNNDSYLYGSFELSYNTCFGNGINGLVFHRTDRAMIKQNIIYDNGVVPRLDKLEPIQHDWYEGCSGKSRQPYSGLVLNNANDVKLWSNRVTARYDDDYAFIQITDNGNPSPLSAGGNNHACKGLLDLNPFAAVNFKSNPLFCLPDVDPLEETNEHACRPTSAYKEIHCGDRCHLIEWPYTMHASYPAYEAKEKCKNDCDLNDCKAFSLQFDYDKRNGDRMCFLYLDSMEPSPESCGNNPFHHEFCSYPTQDGQFFIVHSAAKKYNVIDTC